MYYRETMLKVILWTAILFFSLTSLFGDEQNELNRALERAVRSNDIAAAVSLLDAGADPNVQNEDGRTALMYVTTQTAVNLLLDSGADPTIQDKNGETALLRAWFYPMVVIPLLEAGSDATHQDHRGNTAMHNWGYRQNPRVLEALLSRGCPLDEPNYRGFTPLMTAARSGRGSAVLILLEYGADPNSRDNNGVSVLLHYVKGAEKKRDGSFLVDNNGEKLETVVAALLAAGAQPAVRDNEGDSALLYVMEHIRRGFYDKKYMSLLRDMMLEHTSAEEKRAARAAMSERTRAMLYYNLADNLPALSAALCFLLIVGGLSIVMREKVYKDNKPKNWMGPINAYLALAAGGLILGFLQGARSFRGSGAWADMFGPLATGLFGGFVGFIIGSIIAFLPPVRKAFTNFRVLYYIPSAASAIAAGAIILNVIFDFWY